MTDTLLDDLRKALTRIPNADALKGKFRSCKACHFYKNGYCTQVQPPSKILNVYEAQLCVYYSPETVTTGEITRTERESQASQIDLLKKVDWIELITKIVEVVTVVNITSIDLIDVIQKVVEITTIRTIEEILSPVDPYSLTSKTKVLDKLELAYDEGGNISTVKGFEGADQKYLLTFTWVEGALTQIVRT